MMSRVKGGTLLPFRLSQRGMWRQKAIPSHLCSNTWLWQNVCLSAAAIFHLLRPLARDLIPQLTPKKKGFFPARPSLLSAPLVVVVVVVAHHN